MTSRLLSVLFISRERFIFPRPQPQVPRRWWFPGGTPQGSCYLFYAYAVCRLQLLTDVGDCSPVQTVWIRGPALLLLAGWLWISQEMWVLVAGIGAGVYPGVRDVGGVRTAGASMSIYRYA